jgi:hypothetical protein
MKIRLEVTPDYIGQVIEDLEYLNNLNGGEVETVKKAEILSPYTVKLLQNILAAVEERAVAMVQEGSEFSDVFGEKIEGSMKQGGGDGD